MLKVSRVNMIEVRDWDELVIKTYGKPYSFQQQDDCKPRGFAYLTTPSDYDDDKNMNESIPELVNGSKKGVKFKTWLARDKNQPIPNQEFDYELEMFWERNFYPCPLKLANDLYEKGLIEKGEYMINIDW